MQGATAKCSRVNFMTRSIIQTVILKNHLNMAEFFLGLLSRYFYACTRATSRESNRATKEHTVKRRVLSMSEFLQKHIRACLSRTFFDGSDVEEKLLEALARHT